jgi:hypothetical protein
MTIKIYAKDDVNTVIEEIEVQSFYHDRGAFYITYLDGMFRVYPDRHIWYVERDLDEE